MTSTFVSSTNEPEETFYPSHEKVPTSADHVVDVEPIDKIIAIVGKYFVIDDA